MASDIVYKVLDRISGAGLLATGLLLLTALVSALVAYWRTVEKKSWKEFFEFAIPHEVITHPSARADLLFWVTRKALMPFLMLPAGIVFVSAVGYATNWLLSTLLAIQPPLIEGPAGPVTVTIFTITMLLAYDISYYLYHVAQHRYPVLWELHKVHHSAEVMVGITKDRVHPLDELMNRAWDGVIPGICFGIWLLVSLNLVELTVFGVNVYIIRNILMMDFVRHTHFKISFGPLNNLILCPHWHQLHHSTDPRHYDKNFGLLFSFWDRLFGTLCVPRPDEDFKFGLIERNVRDYQSLAGLYIMPLKRMWWQIARHFRTGKPEPQQSSQRAKP
ncbi:sterol desaturase/sphingolipid hydroxylase (fatty acid hydroxylase superfamily) [Mesorhizobium loti]|uniref:Sterol desaturase/sphingolipid hydroxylase (Fatty acid hydroxylase superfamily) n=1 Tax=Rhizobium loti TaxID=381 RepID=A0A8E2WEB9_RHILI|nr:sterol desaturase family protein [Mesorhizobium loti]PWJ92673.1 sterol desaturase/sphingolipid hydroxylase (fatty acid hydroxylase superfamily) [Mesorhizobium loti]